MSVSLYHTQRIRGFQQQSVKYSGRTMIIALKRTNFNCPWCGSLDVEPRAVSEREIHAEPMGFCRKVILKLTTHRLYCHDCRVRVMEHIHFLSHPKARLTRSLERTILELRQHMSIQATANYFHLRWHTVKELEKRHLKRKYHRIQTAHVKYIGIDEIHVGRGQANSQFLTIVRDLESGAVIHVGDGKGIAALGGALRKLKRSKLKAVAMDMANAYYYWIKRHFPKVKIVFDHFHVIKLMNERLDKVRRRVVSQLDGIQKKQLKGLRFIFLRNHENLDEDSKSILRNMRGVFQDLGDAYMFKEALRRIYFHSNDSYHARIAFHRWCKLAEDTEIPELKSMAKTIRDKLDGIVTYWTYSHMSNSSMEGFNNKIRWLMKQAYGFRDREYFKLKIFQLPEISSVREL